MFYLKNIETASRRKIYNIQNSGFMKSFRKLYSNCMFYNQLLKEKGIDANSIKSIKDITKLPVINKQDLRNPKFNWCEPKSNIINIHRSSGTTGVPTNIPYTRNDMILWQEIMARSLTCVGITKDSVIQNAYGYGLKTGGNGINIGGHRIGAMVIPASTCGTVENINILKDELLQPTVLCCTPSFAQYLGEKIKEYEKHENVDIIKNSKLKIAICGAEPWHEEQRELIEELLNVKAYDIYGLSEILGPGVAIECEYKNGLHIWEDLVYPEILDKDTLQPVEEGKTGVLVLTCLKKEAYPLVRYNTGDICSITYEKCKCGRTHARITRVADRQDDMKIIRGVNIYPSAVENQVLKMIEKHKKQLSSNFQLAVDETDILNQLDVFIEKKNEGEQLDELKKEMELFLKDQIGIKIVVNIVEPNTIDRFLEKSKRIKKITKC